VVVQFALAAAVIWPDGDPAQLETSFNDLENHDLDLRRTGVLALYQMHDEHTVLELGVDVARAGIIREREGTPETATSGFDTWLILVFPFGLKFALGHHRQCTFFNNDLHIFFLYFSQRGPDQVLLVVFTDLYCRGPFGQGRHVLLPLEPVGGGAPQEAVPTMLKSLKVFQPIPTV